MAKNIFHIISNWREGRQSIYEISYVFGNILFELSQFDNLFSKLVLKKLNHKNVSIEIDIEKKEKTIDLIASTILAFHKKDIRQYNKEHNPDIYYSRDLGFSFVTSFYDNNQEIFNIMPRMGNCLSNSIEATPSARISPLGVLMDFKVEPEWYFKLLSIIVKNTDAVLGGVLLRGNPSFTDEVVKYDYPLGWISYFSNEYEIKIPDNLEGFEYEYTDKGKYLIATREDFTVSKEAYQEQKDKLLKTMAYLGETVPGYLRREVK